MVKVPDIIDSLKSRFSGMIDSSFRNQTRVIVPAQHLSAILTALRNEFQFDLLVDVTCVDYLNYRNANHRFGLAYLLCNVDSNIRLTVRTYLDEPNLTVPSAVPLWEGANWLEREVWDMFGIVFDGHPDLRRILLPEEFTAHPLRKDYPLQGRGERHNFTPIRRAQA